MNETFKQILYNLRANAQYYADCQIALREYALDKTDPLEMRFQVWVAHCAKECRDWVLSKGEFGPIGDFVDKFPDEFDRGVQYDWKYFLDACGDNEPSVFNMTREEFMELLIETNFGSFVFDW